MDVKITWTQIRKLNNGTGIGVELDSGERYAGKIVRSEPSKVVLQRADDRGVVTVQRSNIASAELIDWASEMLDYEGE